MPDKILLVDDDPDIMLVLRWALAPAGELLEASDGRTALRLIKAHHPRLILLDVTMPEMDGLEVLRRAREIDPKAIIVMLTGMMDIAVAKEALDSGARAYVTKPFDDQALCDEVRRLLEPPEKRPSETVSGRPWRVLSR
jgi:CheY-like chemotaxis protein